MYNPLDTIRIFRSRLGKPIRPIIELQKGGSIVNVITSSVQTENLINDAYHSEAWEVPPESVASAIYVDGVFKGMGFFAGEEGVVLSVKKDVTIHKDAEQVVNGQNVVTGVKFSGNITAAYKGILGRLLDASLYERGSALKPSLMQTIVYCFLVALVAFMLGMSYAS